MTATMRVAPDTNRIVAASALQKIVPELVALTMDAKQAHWNAVGPSFLALHRLTDELAADARAWTDRVAERVVALGLAVDARPGTVAGVARPFPAGHLADRVAVLQLASAAEQAAGAARHALNELEQSDPVGHDIALAVLEGLERYIWLLRAQAG